MSTAWKDLERRVCHALGGRRAGPTGAAVSDCVNVPFSVEIKRSTRPGPPVLSKWILQARQQSKREHKPWLVVVAGHNDRRPIVTMDFWAFAQLAQEAGRIPTPINEPASEPPPIGVKSLPNETTGGEPMGETATERKPNPKPEPTTVTTTTTSTPNPKPPEPPPGDDDNDKN